MVKKTSPVKVAPKVSTPKKVKKTIGGLSVVNGATVGREVIYKKIMMKPKVGKDAITAKWAKEVMGWEVEKVKDSFKDFLLRDFEGKKVRCNNNVTNRPLNMMNVRILVQEILRRKWKFNAEPIIIGKTGLVLNGQHTLIAIILANQEWASDPDAYDEYWDGPPTIEKAVTAGIDEDDETVNTMDTCKPRSLADVIYRSEYFSDLPVKDKKRLASMADYAVRMLWNRTGHKDAFVPYRSHSESLDFIHRHSRLLECVSKIHRLDKDKEKLISRHLTGGYASALLYLMGSCLTDRDEAYYKMDSPSEDMLDWELWDEAVEFFTLLAAMDRKLDPLREVLGELLDEEFTGWKERVAVFVKAWNMFANGDTLTPEVIRVRRKQDGEGIMRLIENPVVGGIDIGDSSFIHEFK